MVALTLGNEGMGKVSVITWLQVLIITLDLSGTPASHIEVGRHGVMLAIANGVIFMFWIQVLSRLGT